MSIHLEAGKRGFHMAIELILGHKLTLPTHFCNRRLVRCIWHALPIRVLLCWRFCRQVSLQCHAWCLLSCRQLLLKRIHMSTGNSLCRRHRTSCAVYGRSRALLPGRFAQSFWHGVPRVPLLYWWHCRCYEVPCSTWAVLPSWRG